MASKTLRTDPGSIADQIAVALRSARTEKSARVTGLPLAPLALPVAAPSLYCALTPIDDRGRLANRSPLHAIGWQPGQPVTISVVQETVVVISRPNGAESITRQGIFGYLLTLGTSAVSLRGTAYLLRWRRDLAFARLPLAHMGITPEQLLGTGHAANARMPTFREYIGTVSDAVPIGTRRVYQAYWRRIIDTWGDRRLDDPAPLEIKQLCENVKVRAIA